jgi:hypothetical protein
MGNLEMTSHSGGIIRCVRIDFVVGVAALAAACLVSLRADESAASIEGTRPAERQRTDTPRWEARVRAQRLVVRKVEAEYHIARLACEIAEIDLQHYVDWIFPQELINANAEIKRAASALKRAQNRLDWLRNNSYRGFPALPLTTNELDVKKARFALEQALSKKTVLSEFTKGKKTRELKTEADKTRDVEGAKKRAWDLEKLKQSVIEEQIAQWQPVFANRGGVNWSLSRTVRDAFSGEA